MKDSILLPSGLCLRYPDISSVEDADGKKQWVYGLNKIKLYGGKLTENIVQSVARCVMTDQMLQISKRYPIALTVHDECCMVVPEKEAKEALAFVEAVMSRPPDWMPGLPVACEAGTGKRYGDIK
jgi:DNA polymerase